MPESKTSVGALSLPDWGPYSKKYMGVSHIADEKRGLRFDLSVFPGFHRGRVFVPNALWPSGYHVWDATPDLSHYSVRFELEWKNRVYCDLSFCGQSPNARFIRARLVNRTRVNQAIVLHSVASLQLPDILPSTVELPAGGVWINAEDYRELQYSKVRPSDNLVWDGLRRGELRHSGFVGGSGIGHGFGETQGDAARYTFHLPDSFANACLLVRSRAAVNEMVLQVFIDEVLYPAGPILNGTKLSLNQFQIGRLAAGDHRLEVVALGNGAVELDGFAIVEDAQRDAVRFETRIPQVRPQTAVGPDSKSVLLRYEDLNHSYGTSWNAPAEEAARTFQGNDLDSMLQKSANLHVQDEFNAPGSDFFLGLRLQPVVLGPMSARTIEGIVCTGTDDEIRDEIGRFHNDGIPRSVLSKLKWRVPTVLAEGKKHNLSQQLTRATVLTNVVYPITLHGKHEKHYSPGRNWDSLYTWDSGFIGLGLLEMDSKLAAECLRMYLTDPGDQSAFIHHGSPVPVQIFLFLELWNRTHSRELLEFCYPRLRQYHLFLAGRFGSSTTRSLKSNLLKTWDYFYNSGGWDDYPAQVHIHAQGLEGSVSPVINTALAIRTARILSQAADALGLDGAEYHRDIEVFSSALRRHAWDEDSGYYGYVCHDANGEPTGILRTATGENFNMGLDGVFPLVAGVCSKSQTNRLLSHLKSPERLWTSRGITTVDQSAPYFSRNGYWNGTVWMPHQWFLWKALLDLGESDLAWQIADTALNLWKRETVRSYNCYEHFDIQTGRGGGWHQFSGLSTPLISWFYAYYRPGTLTAGFDVWIERHEFSAGNSRLMASLKINAPKAADCSCVIVCIAPSENYSVECNGTNVPFKVRFPGLLEVSIPATIGSAKLEVAGQPCVTPAKKHGPSVSVIHSESSSSL